MDRQKRNRIIAREILLFFSALTIVGLIWTFLFLRNQYYERKISKMKMELLNISNAIDSLPKDRIKALYEGIKLKLIENYQVKGEKYAILKEDEEEFLQSFPNAEHLSPSPNGYSYFKGRYPYSDKDDYDLPPPPPKNLNRPSNDSTAIFDYISLDKFRKFVANSDYSNKLYLTFSEQFDLGEKPEFDYKIKDGLSFNQSLIDSLLRQKSVISGDIQSSKYSKLNNREVIHTLLWCALILGIILYPMRLIYFAIRWSIQTLNKNAT